MWKGPNIFHVLLFFPGMFSEQDNDLHKKFVKAANNKRNDFDFAHTFAPEILQNYKFENAIVLFRPSHLHAKFEDAYFAMTNEEENVYNIEKFIDENQYVFDLYLFFT